MVDAAFSVVTYAELLEGAHDAYDPPSRIEEVQNLARALTLLEVDIETAGVLGELRSRLRRQGQLIGAFDMVIAATALRHGLSLMSRDQGFDRIPELRRA